MGWELAYLATDPMTIQEGQWAIAQAIINCLVKARGLGHPHVNLSTQKPFRFDCTRGSPIKDTPGDVSSGHQLLPHQPQGAETAVDIRGTKGYHCLSYHHLPKTMGSRVIGAHYQQIHQCHPCQIDQRDPSIPNMGDDTKKMGPI